MVTNLQNKHLYLDCFAGVAGDMFLGAALDLGVPDAVVREGLNRLGVSDRFELVVRRGVRMGIEGCDVRVKVHGHGHGHHHHHGHDHKHRRWVEILEMIVGAGLPAGARDRALDIFGRIARAEAGLHGMDPEEVSFHEVGAMDSIVDIVGAALALDWLAPARITARPVPLGHGSTRCAHGILPVPAPAALKILEGCEVEDGGADMELTTPTGAAIVASCVDGFGQLPPARLVGSGYGAGDGDLADRANHLRLVALEPVASDDAEQEAVVVEANVDNMPPEWCGHLMERLFAAGARDVWYTPIVMKKNRPALTISALCAAALVEQIGAVLLAESTTIGLRHYPVDRRTLGRRSVTLATPHGEVEIKLALDGERVLNAAPEYRTCKAVADQTGVPLKEIYAAALAAYHRSRGD